MLELRKRVYILVYYMNQQGYIMWEVLKIRYLKIIQRVPVFARTQITDTMYNYYGYISNIKHIYTVY